MCPDSGATCNIISEKLVKKHKLVYVEKGDQGITLLDAQGKHMSVLRVVNVFILIPVPLHQVEAAELEVSKLLRSGVIRKVSEPTTWTSPVGL